ncbi:MAG: Hsp20/alpha crystallin family protein [Verrucomicrobiota bacterium]
MSDKNEMTRCGDNEISDATRCQGSALTEYRTVNLRPEYHSRYDDEAWEVSVTLPGVRKEEVQVRIENEILEIKAARVSEHPEKWKPIAEYPSRRNYSLRLDVGPEVDAEKVSAEHQNGILTLRLPLREEVKARKIEVH